MRTLTILVILTLGSVYTPTTRLAWDPVTKDVKGEPESVVEAEAGIFDLGGTTPLATQRGIDPSGEGWNPGPLLAGRAETSYEFRVRVYDEAGNVSAWSNVVEMLYDVTPPAAPTGCRLFK